MARQRIACLFVRFDRGAPIPLAYSYDEARTPKHYAFDSSDFGRWIDAVARVSWDDAATPRTAEPVRFRARLQRMALAFGVRVTLPRLAAMGGR